MAIIWLASYPKSGNTWTRAFLTNYMEDGDKPADINALFGGWSHLSRSFFDDYMGMSSSDMTQAEINHYRPILHRHLSELSDKPLVIKSHEVHRNFPSGQSFFAPIDGCKVIHLVRNPLDVAVSYAHHIGKSIDRAIEIMRDPHAMMSGRPLRFAEVTRGWSNFNESWLEQDELDCLTLRYEDMLLDPINSFAKIVNFIGLPLDMERLDKALSFCSFSEMQSQEQKRGFQEGVDVKRSFFRKGVAGSWSKDLSEDQISEIIHDHRNLMQRMGYDYLDIAG